MASSHNLIFLHGWGTDSRVWKHQVEYFSNKCKVETPAVIASGVSEANEAKQSPYGEASHSQKRDCFVGPSGLLAMTDAILIGWSYGGMLAIEMVSKWPEKFKALALVGCSARFTDGINQVIIKNLRRNLTRDYAATMRNCYGQFFSAEEAGFIDEFIKGQVLPDKKTTIELLEKLATLDLKNCLKDINCPTLIIHGDKDEICRIGAGQYLNQNIKGSHIKIIKGAGHMPFYTRPEEFNEILEEFIKGVK